MCRRRCLIVRRVMLGALIVAGLGWSAGAAQTNGPANPPPLWFPVGEGMVYRLAWGFIPIGKSQVTTRWVKEGERWLVAIRYRAKTNRLFNRIYPVNDTAETRVDPVTFLPVRFELKLTRRAGLTDQTTTFDHPSGVAVVEDRLAGATNRIPIETTTRDLVSYAYYMRGQPLLQNATNAYRVLAETNLLDIMVVYRGKEKTDLPLYGKIPTVRVEPQADFGSLLIDEGKVSLWAASDDRRLGVMLMIRAPVANVRATLCQVQGPGDDRWITLPKEEGAKNFCEEEPDVEAALAETPEP